MQENFIVHDDRPLWGMWLWIITAQHRSGSQGDTVRIVYKSFFQPGATENFDEWKFAAVTQLLKLAVFFAKTRLIISNPRVPLP